MASLLKVNKLDFCVFYDLNKLYKMCRDCKKQKLYYLFLSTHCQVLLCSLNTQINGK